MIPAKDKVNEQTLKHRIDHLEGLVNLLAHFSSREHDFPAHKDQKHNLGLDHAVDETREKLRLVRAKVVMARSQTLETNGKFDVTRPNDVLNLEVRKLGIESKLLDDSCVLARGQLGVVFGLGSGDNHLARGKDQGSRLRLADTHDDSGETLGRSVKMNVKSYSNE